MARAWPAVEEFNEAVLAHLEQSENLMRARDTLFILLAATAGAAMATVAGEELLRADLLGRMDVASRDQGLELSEATWVSLPPAEAISFFRKKLPMVEDEYEKIEDRYKARGFTVAGLRNRYAVEKVHAALSEAIEKGTTKRDFIKTLRDPKNKAGLEGLTRRHLELVFDHNVLASYAAGRYAQMTDPDLLKLRPYWQYKTAGDERVRLAHRAMDGKVFAADSPVWDQWYPPNGYRCRCSVFSLSRRDLEREGLKVEDKLPQAMEVDGKVVQMVPDPGFAGSPRTQAIAHRRVEEVKKQAKRQQMLRSPETTEIKMIKPKGEPPPRSADAEGWARQADAAGPTRPPMYHSAGDLLRGQDVQRNAKVDRYSELAAAAAEQIERDGMEQRGPRKRRYFNLYRDLGEVPPDEHWVEIPVYSQNLDTVEQLVTRIAQHPSGRRMAETMRVTSRASYGDYDTSEWPDPEVAHDAAAGKRLGMAKGHVFSRSTETILRLVARSHDELRAAKEVALQTETSHRDPIRRAWEVADIRVRGLGATKEKNLRPAYLNSRPQGVGQQAVLTRGAPIPEWKSEEIQVTERMWGFLPDYSNYQGKGRL